MWVARKGKHNTNYIIHLHNILWTIWRNISLLTIVINQFKSNERILVRNNYKIYDAFHKCVHANVFMWNGFFLVSSATSTWILIHSIFFHSKLCNYNIFSLNEMFDHFFTYIFLIAIFKNLTLSKFEQHNISRWQNFF